MYTPFSCFDQALKHYRAQSERPIRAAKALLAQTDATAQEIEGFAEIMAIQAFPHLEAMTLQDTQTRLDEWRRMCRETAANIRAVRARQVKAGYTLPMTVDAPVLLNGCEW